MVDSHQQFAMSSTPLLDKVTTQIIQGIDYFMNEIVLGSLDRGITALGGKVMDGLNKVGDSLAASVPGMETVKSTVGLGDKGNTERGQGLALSQGDDLALQIGARSQDGGLGTQGMDKQISAAVANCEWTKSCNMQPVAQQDLGQMFPNTAGLVQTHQQGVMLG